MLRPRTKRQVRFLLNIILRAKLLFGLRKGRQRRRSGIEVCPLCFVTGFYSPGFGFVRRGLVVAVNGKGAG